MSDKDNPQNETQQTNRELSQPEVTPPAPGGYGPMVLMPPMELDEFPGLEEVRRKYPIMHGLPPGEGDMVLQESPHQMPGDMVYLQGVDMPPVDVSVALFFEPKQDIGDGSYMEKLKDISADLVVTDESQEEAGLESEEGLIYHPTQAEIAELYAKNRGRTHTPRPAKEDRFIQLEESVNQDDDQETYLLIADGVAVYSVEYAAGVVSGEVEAEEVRFNPDLLPVLAPLKEALRCRAFLCVDFIVESVLGEKSS